VGGPRVVRLFVIVEGETEETFVNEILAPHLYARGFLAVSAKLMGNARLRTRRGGIRPWAGIRDEIVRHMRGDGALHVTTMVDYYGLPQQKAQRAWPGRAQASRLPFEDKALNVESAIAADIAEKMGKAWNPSRFIPFVMMHEFEGLLFSDCEKLASGIGKPALSTKFQRIRDKFSSPEEINDAPETHPSQRIVDLIPEYEKPLHGNLAALEIGFEPIRTECPHFQEWISRLESLAK
jgi:hypothetical protein